MRAVESLSSVERVWQSQRQQVLVELADRRVLGCGSDGRVVEVVDDAVLTRAGQIVCTSGDVLALNATTGTLISIADCGDHSFDGIVAADSTGLDQYVLDTDGRLWVRGMNGYGQHGLGVDDPEPSRWYWHEVCDDVDWFRAGDRTLVVASHPGDLLVAGADKFCTGDPYDQLGGLRPLRVDHQVADVVLGSKWTLLCDTDGRLWDVEGTFGWRGGRAADVGAVREVVCGTDGFVTVDEDRSALSWQPDGKGVIGQTTVDPGVRVVGVVGHAVYLCDGAGCLWVWGAWGSAGSRRPVNVGAVGSERFRLGWELASAAPPGADLAHIAAAARRLAR